MERVEVGKLVGMSSPTQWSQVHSFLPKGERGEERGMLVLAVSIGQKEQPSFAEATEGMDLAAFGQEVIQRLHEEYYGVAEEETDAGGLLERLKATIEKVVGEFGTVAMTVAGGVVKEHLGRWVMYVGLAGQGGAVLVRKGEVFEMVRRRDEEGEAKTMMVSGWLEEGDVAVIGTEALWQLVRKEDLVRMGEKETVEEMVEELAPELVRGKALEAGLTAGTAGVVVKINRTGAVKTTVVEESGGGSVSEVEDQTEREAERVGGIGEKIAGGWEWLKQRWPRRQGGGIYVRSREEERKAKMRMMVAIILGILLMVSVGLGWQKRQTDKAGGEARAIKESIERQIAEGRELGELNPQRARTVLEEAKGKVEEYGQRKLKKEEQSWVETKLSEIGELIQAGARIYEVGQPEVFLDLDLVREGSWGEVMDLADGQVAVLDRQHQVVLRVGLAKTSGIVGGGELLVGAKWLAVASGRAFVLGEKGIIEVNVDKKTTAVVVKPEEQWGEIADMKAWSGKVYLMDKGKNQIWRYAAEGGTGEAWFKPGKEADLSRAAAMAIDGSIWILTETGKLVKYTRGSPEAFEITGVDKQLAQPTALYTNSDLERMYILDKGNARVVVVGKGGEYQAQYHWEGMNQVMSIVASEKEKKLLLLTGRMIYEIDLR